jgi:adenylate cyclase
MGVNVAARVTALAAGGQVLATRAVAGVARAEGRSVTALGTVELKNLSGRVDLYSIELGSALAAEAVDPVCRMRVRQSKAAAHVRVDDHDYYFCSVECAASFLAKTGAPSS